MNWTAKLVKFDKNDLNPEHFTKDKEYSLSDDGYNETYSYHGKPVPMDSLKGTDFVIVEADDKGERCMICKWRFGDVPHER